VGYWLVTGLPADNALSSQGLKENATSETGWWNYHGRRTPSRKTL
jgi:hypothetical protein